MVNFDIKNGVRIIKETALDASTGPGIYKMIGDGDEVLYIGKAKNLAKRIQQYGDIQKLPNRLKKMVSMVMKIETLLTTNEVEALLLEANLIKSTLPRFNILLKDDKRFPYIVIEEGHEFPRISKYRGIKKSSGMCYYGPFADSGNSQSNVAELQKIFLVRSCTNSYFKARKRPCLLYQIKRCSAPCVGKITHEEYKKSIKQLKAFFSGKGSDIQGELLSAMKEASAKLNFEKAALIRDRIRLLSKIQNRSNLSALNLQIKHLERADIFAVYYNNGFISITVLFIRNGENCGSISNCYEAVCEDDLDQGSMLQSFVMNFYYNIPLPKVIYINSENNDILQQALSSLYNSKIKVLSPNHEIKNLYDFAIINGKEYLEKYTKLNFSKNEILEDVRKIFKLEEVPNRIEVYDNSHISGQYPVGAMIVAGKDGFLKKEYRLFKFKWNLHSKKNSGKKIATNSCLNGDDYYMLYEMLYRRLKKVDSYNKPDLIIVDGGIGQLNVANKVLQDLSLGQTEISFDKITVIGMSKGIERNKGLEIFITNDSEPFRLPQDSKTLHYLQVLRDEAHKFAITNHRKMRSKNISISKLDLMPGIGPKKKNLLLTTYGSIEEIKKASNNNLAKLIGRKLALVVAEYLSSAT